MSSRHDERMLRHKVHRRFLVLHHAAWQVFILFCHRRLFAALCIYFAEFVIELTRVWSRHTQLLTKATFRDRPTDQFRLGLWTRSYIYWCCDIQMPYFLKHFSLKSPWWNLLCDIIMQDIYIIETGQQPKRDFTFLVTSSRMTNVSAGKISINVTLVITSINRKSNGQEKKKKNVQQFCGGGMPLKYNSRRVIMWLVLFILLEGHNSFFVVDSHFPFQGRLHIPMDLVEYYYIGFPRLFKYPCSDILFLNNKVNICQCRLHIEIYRIQ